ncbi:MAG: hypothetical protein K1X89_15820 [Myxococcaceae bacterium]|nr:hypothetical protein [Myxococcaceae bacterium]
MNAHRLPPLARTGIGSLPVRSVARALEVSFALELPFLPQLTSVSASEGLIATALDGLPGLELDAQGKPRLGEAGGDAEAFEPLPDPEASRCWRPFLDAVAEHRPGHAKVQLAGPFTVLTALQAAPERDAEVAGFLTARAVAMAKAVRAEGCTPVVFLDEPWLVSLRDGDARQVSHLAFLGRMVAAVKATGAVVGLHCCGNTHWSRVLALGIDLLSFDVRCSLDALLDERAALHHYLFHGGALALGIVPTEPDAVYRVGELVEALEVSLASSHFEPHRVLANAWLTPACGLAGHTEAQADRVFAELAQAQAALRSA